MKLSLLLFTILIFQLPCFGEVHPHFSPEKEKALDTLYRWLDSTTKQRKEAPNISIDQAINLAKECGKEDLIPHLLYRKAENNLTNKKTQQAMENLSRACEIFNKTHQILWLGKSLGTMANIYFQTEEYDKAIEYALWAVKTFESINNQDEIRDALNTLGQSWGAMGKYYESMQCFKKILPLDQALKDDCSSTVTLNNIGIIHYYLNDLNQAYDYYTRAMDIIKQDSNCKKCYSKLLNNIGNVLDVMQQDSAAIQYYQLALKEFKKEERLWDIGNTLNNISSVYIRNHHYTKAETCLFSAQKIAHQYNSQDLLLNNYNCFASLYKNQKKYKQALFYFQKHALLKDSIYNTSRDYTISKLKNQFEKERKEHILNEKNNKIANQKIWMTALMALAITIFTFLMLLFKRNRIIQQANRILVKKNLQIMASEKEFRQMSQNNSTTPLSKTSILSSSDNSRYQTSHLTDNQKAILLNKLQNTLPDKSLYLSDEMNLDTLAAHLNTNKNYLSQIINETYGTTFRNFLNQYRIKEACELLTKKEYQNIKIEAIGAMVGYKSKSTFNRSFKEYAGVTPSVFRDNLPHSPEHIQ